MMISRRFLTALRRFSAAKMLHFGGGEPSRCRPADLQIRIKNDIFKKQITTDSAFWSATVGINTPLFPGANGTEFNAGTASDTYYLAIPLKQN